MLQPEFNLPLFLFVILATFIISYFTFKTYFVLKKANPKTDPVSLIFQSIFNVPSAILSSITELLSRNKKK